MMVWPLDLQFIDTGDSKCWVCEQRPVNPHDPKTFPPQAIAVWHETDTRWLLICEWCVVVQPWLPRPPMAARR
jgi:hypothetical protein